MPLIICFAGWGALCALAALRGRMILWAAMCLLPLALLSFSWWWISTTEEVLRGPIDIRWLYLLSFVAMSFITASTGVLSMVVANAPAPAAPRRPKGNYTLWQKLWWKPLPKKP